MKLVITGDLHLDNYYGIGNINPRTGLTYRFADFLSNFDIICQYALEHGDLLVILGDVFHPRDPKGDIRRAFAKILKNVMKKLPVIIIIGNHDLFYQKGTGHTVIC